MADASGWDDATWEGHRRRQHREFQALSLRQKLAIIEQLGEVAAFFAERRRARGLPVASRDAGPAPGASRDDSRSSS
jgi:hypothetical protein